MSPVSTSFYRPSPLMGEGKGEGEMHARELLAWLLVVALALGGAGAWVLTDHERRLDQQNAINEMFTREVQGLKQQQEHKQ